MKRLNLRRRITLAISVVCIVILSVTGGLFYMASERMELALVEQLVAEELDFLIQRHQADPGYVPTPGLNVEYYIVPSDGNLTELPPFLRDLGAGHYELDIGENRGERDIVIRQLDGFRYIVVYNIGPYEQREQKFKNLVLASLVLAMGLTVILGYLLSGFLTRQLSLLAEKVSTLEPGQAYQSLLRDEQDAEVAMLALAFDEYHELFLSMIRREQEFTANVSHELRTPLTAIGTSCELLIADPSLSERARLRVRQIMQSVKDMTQHIQALLLLARQQELGTREEVALRECVEDVVVHFRENMDKKGLACNITIPAAAEIHANRLALQIVLNNLLRNAVTHTASGFVRVDLVDRRLEVTDSGPGIPAEKLPHIFQRAYRGASNSEGLGLGLDIVKRVCERAGWTIEVRSEPGIGSTFSLVL